MRMIASHPSNGFWSGTAESKQFRTRDAARKTTFPSGSNWPTCVLGADRQAARCVVARRPTAVRSIADGDGLPACTTTLK